MRLILLPPLLLASLTAAATTTQDASHILLNIWPTSGPSPTGAQLTSVASALASATDAFTNSPAYTSAISAIYSAAPSSIQSSFLAASSTITLAALTTESWYINNVPASAQKVMAAEEKSLYAVAVSYLGTGTGNSADSTPVIAGVTGTGSSKGVAAKATGIGAAAAGVLGMMGVIIAL